MNNKSFTDEEIEAKLFALADSNHNYDKEKMKHVILKALRDKHAELMRRRRRAHRVLGGIVSACIVACACFFLPGTKEDNAAKLAVSEMQNPTADCRPPAVHFSQVGTPSSRGFTIELPPKRNAHWRKNKRGAKAYYSLALEPTPF